MIIIILLTACTAESPPPVEALHFEETGFTVQGEFAAFYQHYGGEASLGLPISAEMDTGGWRVQYFEYGRLEYHPENTPTYRVTVGWLGDLLNRRQPPIPPESVPGYYDLNRRYFAETGHTLSGDFLRYFEARGDTVRFGKPISEPFLHEGRLVQDFQSARFIWTPEQMPTVTLEPIGRVHLETLRQ